MSERLEHYEHPYRDLDDVHLNNAQLRARIERTMLSDQLRRADKTDRPTIIVDNVIQALDIAPRLEDLMIDGEIPEYRRADAERAARIANSLQNAQTFLHEHQQTMNRREFGDMMMDIVDEIEEHHDRTNLYRALTHLRATTPTVYRDELTQAHRQLLVALYIETSQPT